MYFKITLEDNITPQIKRWLQDNPRFIRSVLKSTGYMVQKQLKKDIAVISLAKIGRNAGHSQNVRNW